MAVSPVACGVEDIFGRPLNEHGLILVDWEGYIANPAIKFFILPPPNARYPARVVVRAGEPRLYFDLPEHERGRTARGRRSGSIAPRRRPCSSRSSPTGTALDEDYALEVEFTDADGAGDDP